MNITTSNSVVARPLLDSLSASNIAVFLNFCRSYLPVILIQLPLNQLGIKMSEVRLHSSSKILRYLCETEFLIGYRSDSENLFCLTQPDFSVSFPSDTTGVPFLPNVFGW